MMTLPTVEDSVRGVPATVRDVDPRKPPEIDDPHDTKPSYWDDRRTIIEPNYETGKDEEIDNPDYMGPFKPRLIPNDDRFHNYLPNTTFSSDHLALLVELEFASDALLSEWH